MPQFPNLKTDLERLQYIVRQCNQIMEGLGTSHHFSLGMQSAVRVAGEAFNTKIEKSEKGHYWYYKIPTSLGS